MRAPIVALCLFGALFVPRPVRADLPDAVPATAVASLDAEIDRSGGGDVAVVCPRTPGSPQRDPKQGALYSYTCGVYLRDADLFRCRFVVHVSDADSLPIARRAGRFLGLLWREARHRFGSLASGLRRTTVQVWLARGGEPGGEQYNNNLYIYDLYADRNGIEWARELAHEYGHYLLPGSSGYREPENWSNGVLGERLFLNWLRDARRAVRIAPHDLPYVQDGDLADYCARQVEPLLERMGRDGPDLKRLAERDGPAMDAFTALILYACDVYGSSTLFDLLAYLPTDHAVGADGTAFASALQLWLDQAERFRTVVWPAQPVRLYVPKGRFSIETDPAGAATLAMEGVTLEKTASGWSVTAGASGWRKTSVSSDVPTLRLDWQRR